MICRIKRTIDNGILYFRQRCIVKQHNNMGKTVYIELTKVKKGMIRRLSQIYKLFEISGYTCYIHIPFLTFIQLKNFLNITREDNFVLSARAAEKTAQLTVFDKENPIIQKKCIYVDYSVFEKVIATEKNIFYPISFHPDILSISNEKEALDLSSNNNRKIGVFFAGNLNRRKYSDPRTKEYFRINTRYEIIQEIQNKLAPSKLYCPSSFAELIENMESGNLKNKVVIVDTDIAKIPSTRWFSIIGESDFFLHTPGILYPWCHNQIESMATGTIPITQFPHIFHPNLKDGENSLTWNNFSELRDTLEIITDNKMSDEVVNNLRLGTIRYYREIFSFSSFSKRLQMFINDPDRKMMRMFICAGEHSMSISKSNY